MKKNEQGRSMIEMLGVLAIIGVLSVGGIAGFSKAMAKYRINKFVGQISMISHNITTLFASQKSYEDLRFSDVILKAKLVPEEMMEYGQNGELTGIINPWATRVGISYADRYSADDKRAYYINTWGLPLDACIELATYDWSQNSSVMAVSLGFESTGPMASSDSANYSREGCQGIDDGNPPLVGCAGGSIVSLPIPLSKAVPACESSPEIAIKFR